MEVTVTMACQEFSISGVKWAGFQFLLTRGGKVVKFDISLSNSIKISGIKVKGAVDGGLRMSERHVHALCLKGVCFWVIAIQAGVAGEVRVLDKPLSAEEMGALLFPEARPRTRSLSFSLSEMEREKGASIALALPIQFALNSAEIQDEAIPFLDEIGRMLTMDQFRQGRLLIEGHTDATGPKLYNNRLSKKRAEAVKNYLVSRFAIDPHRLRIVGLGEENPLPGKHPNDPLNRRVELRQIVE